MGPLAFAVTSEVLLIGNNFTAKLEGVVAVQYGDVIQNLHDCRLDHDLRPTCAHGPVQLPMVIAGKPKYSGFVWPV